MAGVKSTSAPEGDRRDDRRTAASSPADALELAPITDQLEMITDHPGVTGRIDARVTEALAELRAEAEPTPSAPRRAAPDGAPPSFAAVSTDAALDVDEEKRRRPPEPVAPPTDDGSAAERALRRKRILVRALLALVALLAAAALLVFTPLGEGVVPEPLRKTIGEETRSAVRNLPGLEGDALYTFTDDEGVVHIVDHLDKVPAQYRARAKKSE